MERNIVEVARVIEACFAAGLRLRVVVDHLISPRRLECCVIFFSSSSAAISAPAGVYCY